MLIKDLTYGIENLDFNSAQSGIEISGITADSREVQKGDLFIAVRGFQVDGHNFISSAIEKGAFAFVIEKGADFDRTIFNGTDLLVIEVEDSRKALAIISNNFYNNPSTKITLTGITGTKGKTTTAFFVKNLFETVDKKCGLIGTIANYIADEKIDSKLTTPESYALNEFFHSMVENKCEAGVIEVSSHALELKRVYGLDFDFAAFTNLGNDHLDFHKTVENYTNAKKTFFDNLKPNAYAVVNSDDPNWKTLTKDTKAKVYTFGENSEADFRITDTSYDLSGTKFKIIYKNVSYDLKTMLIGKFNAYNAAIAFAIGMLSNFDIDSIIKSIAYTPQIPGRFEVVSNVSKKIIVDYSHTAESLEQALTAINKMNRTEAQVVTVFGCGGDRDKSKRPVMGKVASENSDLVVVTSDNPRTEDPYEILEDIRPGLMNSSYEIIENRKEAIKYAIENSEEDAVILIAGKGHETYQEINGIKNYFSDKEVALEFIQ